MSDQSNHLWELLSAAVTDRADEAFLTDLRSGQVITYEDLQEHSRSAAAWLAEREIGVGDRVAYLTKNDPAFFPILFGCASLGAALVPINEDSAEGEIVSVLEDSGAAIVLQDGNGTWEGATPARELIAGAATPRDPTACPPEQAAIVIYTSGTTGRSKGVLLSHRNLTSMSATLASVYGYASGQRFLSMLPNYHINAPVVTGLSCIAGRSHVFVTAPYGFTNARFILDFVEEHGIGVLSLTPSIMASLLQFNPGGTDRDISSVSFGLVGTAHLSEKLWRRFEDVFGFPCYQGYGLTETTTWATMTPPDERKRHDSAGVAIGCEVAIDEDAGSEVLIRGDIVMSGYHNRKALTRKQFKDGWLRTGDIGRIEDGQLYITGRIKNIIKRKGILISPEEIDGVVRRFPQVTDACTVGVVDELLGERVVTACVLEDEHLEALQAHTRAGLSAYKYPDEFVVVGEVPKTGMGKPDLAEMRRIVSGEKALEVVASFDVYRFRRARSQDMPAITQLIQRSLMMAQPLELVTFWGVGTRDAVATPDVAALDRLASFRDAIAEASGRNLAALTLVLADVHALCNQVPAEVHEPYFAAIGSLAEERGFHTTWLSKVWAEHDLDFEEILGQMKRNERLEEWESFPLREDFLKQAAQRCGDPSLAEDFAYRYFLTTTTENPALASSFEGFVFLTFNGPEFRMALPPMPMLHLHSLKPGVAAKPWFLGD